ncbi:branched-chain amino acid ABC transporter ATP-binding protein [Salmonella enterica subsp. enterica serovar Choleraesuis]|nr:branched-chain amino acid ABC transporter ATP-binding protein [Salmonella enterica subsp. enterica serovar Choleraesuis]
MLSLHAVNQFYGEHHTLQDIFLELKHGGATCIIGAAGTGKTTLMNCIAGTQPVASGHILWQEEGQPLTELAEMPSERRVELGIGFQPGSPRFFSQLTVEQNLHIVRQSMPEGPTAALPSVYNLFPILDALRHVRVSELSEENNQRLALACALQSNPRLLLLDEPCRGRSSGFIHELGTILRRLNQDFGVAILLAERNIPLIRVVTDRFVLLHRGRNVAHGRVALLDDLQVGAWLTP